MLTNTPDHPPTFGIQVWVRNKFSGWACAKGERLIFNDREDANRELQSWRRNGWWPSTVRYTISTIED